MNRTQNQKRRNASDNGKPLVDKIISRGGRCMEQVIDAEHALFFERWLLPNGVGVVVLYSDQYRECFIEATPGANSWDATEGALTLAAACDPKVPHVSTPVAIPESDRIAALEAQLAVARRALIAAQRTFEGDYPYSLNKPKFTQKEARECALGIVTRTLNKIGYVPVSDYLGGEFI